MRNRWRFALLVAAAWASTPAAAQAPAHNDTATTTETQERRAADRDSSNTIWNLVGLLGLFGLIGMWRPSDNDGYTGDPI